MALTGCDDVATDAWEEKRQVVQAETIPGPSTLEIAALTERYRLYAIFGMPERAPDRTDVVYNAVAILGPDGVIKSYRKMHCFDGENHWATKGDCPGIFDTPWGPIGASICYDTFHYPELLRYARARGARLHVSCTANSASASKYPLIRTELEGQEVAMYSAAIDLSYADEGALPICYAHAGRARRKTGCQKNTAKGISKEVFRGVL